jgi:Aldo/keto reductase family
VTVTAAAAGTWRLGDLTVNRLGFGAMRLTGGGVFGRGAPGDRDRSIRVLRRAVELGVNHIDTAAFCFSPLRSANELINRALAPHPDDLVIATKVGPGRDPSGASARATCAGHPGHQQPGPPHRERGGRRAAAIAGRTGPAPVTPPPTPPPGGIGGGAGRIAPLTRGPGPHRKLNCSRIDPVKG